MFVETESVVIKSNTINTQIARSVPSNKAITLSYLLTACGNVYVFPRIQILHQFFRNFYYSLSIEIDSFK